MKKKILWIIPTALVILFFLMLFSSYSMPIQVIEYDMYLEISGGTDDMCASGDTDALYFGRIPPMAQTKREVTIKNLPETSKVVMSVEGPLSSWTKLSENNFIMQPDELTKVSIRITAPSKAELGDYTSTFKIAFYKTLFR